MADKVKVAGVEYDMPARLKIGEQLDMARALAAENVPSDSMIGLACATVWIAVRRVYPQTLLADLLNEDYDIIEGEPDEVEKLLPTNGAGSASGSPEAAAPTTTGTPPSGISEEPSPGT